MRTNVNEIRLSALSDDESLTRINDGKRPGAEVHASADKRASFGSGSAMRS
jgi:hypothetical protein